MAISSQGMVYVFSYRPLMEDPWNVVSLQLNIPLRKTISQADITFNNGLAFDKLN